MLKRGSIRQTILVLIIFSCFNLELQAQSLALTDEYWEVIDNENGSKLDLQTTNYKGKKAIHLGRYEFAQLKDVAYENFVLEMEIAGKAMPGVGFRAKDLLNYEFFYCRVFSGGKMDALQYIPVYNGAHPWQLYNEPIYETKADFQPQEWFKVRMEVYGKNMRIFIGDNQIPNMEVGLLQKDLDSGSIFLKTSFAEAYFSNISIRALETPFEINQPKPDYKYLSFWKISEQVEGNIHAQGQFFNLIGQARENHTWKHIKADETGIINLAEYFSYPKQSVFAETSIISNEDKTVKLAFDYTQVLLIAINNQIVFYGRELDLSNFMRMTDAEQTIDLNLKEGENQLTFWIRSDDEWQEAVDNPAYLGRKQAMNWGFMARLIE